MMMIRAEMLESAIMAQCFVLEPMLIEMTVVRNLALGFYVDGPLTTISVHVPQVAVYSITLVSYGSPFRS